MLSVVAKISDGVGECRVDWAVHWYQGERIGEKK